MAETAMMQGSWLRYAFYNFRQKMLVPHSAGEESTLVTDFL